MYGQPLTFWQRLMQRFQPTPIQMAKAELKDAELATLQCISQAEYARLRSQVHELTADYHQKRAERLYEFIHKEEHLIEGVSSITIPDFADLIKYKN